MRYVLMVLILFVSALVSAQTAQSPDQIRAQMAEIRRTTNWDDPAAAAKANAEIKKLANQLTGGKSPFNSRVVSRPSKVAANHQDLRLKLLPLQRRILLPLPAGSITDLTKPLTLLTKFSSIRI